MKKIVLLLFILFSILPAKAQLLEALKLNPKDFISKGEKNDSLEFQNKLLEKALSPDLYIIRQQYRLERKGKTYGKNHKPYYGETYSLGIKVSGGMYVSNAAIEPWKGDADYERVNADGKYKPEHFWTYQRTLNDSVYKAIELDYGTSYISAVNADKSLWLHQDLQSDFGLAVDNSLGEKKGYMLWAYSKTNAQDSAMVVELRQSVFKTTVKVDSMLIPMSLSYDGKLIGGLFVVPKYDKGGVVKMMLAGVAVKNEATKWSLQLFANTQSSKKVVPNPPAESTTKPEKSEKKKKQEKQEDSSEPTPTK